MFLLAMKLQCAWWAFRSATTILPSDPIILRVQGPYLNSPRIDHFFRKTKILFA